MQEILSVKSEMCLERDVDILDLICNTSSENARVYRGDLMSKHAIQKIQVLNKYNNKSFSSINLGWLDESFIIAPFGLLLALLEDSKERDL